MEDEAQFDTNLQGQKLGRKGRVTRERILEAALALIEDADAEPLSLSAVARRADLRISSIYTYFADLTELFLTVLDPVARSAQHAYLHHIEMRWPDDELGEKCAHFVHAFHDYWKRNARLLHLRNAFAEQRDTRVLLQRIGAARKVIHLLGQQMGAPDTRTTGPEFDLASVLYTGLERVVTIATDEQLKQHYPENIRPRFQGATLAQQARLMELAIRDERRRLAEG